MTIEDDLELPTGRRRLSSVYVPSSAIVDDDDQHESTRAAISRIWKGETQPQDDLEVFQSRPTVHFKLLRQTARLELFLVIVFNFNALLMGVTEAIVEILVVAEAMPKIPFRLDFLVLTLVSTVLGFQTLRGVAMRSIEVTRDALQLAIIVEVGLVLGDSVFLAGNAADYPVILPVRIPFMVLTTTNIFLIIYLYWIMVKQSKEVIVLQRADLDKDPSKLADEHEAKKEARASLDHDTAISTTLANKHAAVSAQQCHEAMHESHKHDVEAAAV